MSVMANPLALNNAPVSRGSSRRRRGCRTAGRGRCAVDLGERQVLMLECVVVRVLQLVEQVSDGGGRCDSCAHGTVLINRPPSIPRRPPRWAARKPRAEHDIGDRSATSASAPTRPAAPCSRGVAGAGQLVEARVVSAATRSVSLPRAPSPNRSGGPTRVGVSRSASTSRQAACAASRSRSPAR